MIEVDAAVGPDGILEWHDAEGRLHREGGPARVHPAGRDLSDGRRIWFEEGVKVGEERED